jgi:predicted amidohydrolase YtcJ
MHRLRSSGLIAKEGFEMSYNKRQHGFSRRKFIQAAAAAAGGTMFAPPALALDPRRKSRPNHPDLDMILVDGRIHTMDARNRVVSSVGIKDGRFVDIGKVGRHHAGRETRVCDLNGRTVVPGIIDNHNHLVLMGNRPGFHTPLENAHSIAEALAIYAARARRVPRDAWITTIGGFHFNHLYANPADKTSGRFPTLAELDSVTPNNPVWLSISFAGPSVTNTAGRNILNGLSIDGQTISVAEDGSIAAGFPSSQSTLVLLHLRRTLLNAAERRRSTLDAMKYAASLGVTTHIDQGAFQKTDSPTDGAAHEDNFTMHIPFLEVYDQGDGIVRLRINFLHMETDDATPELEQRLKNAFPFFGNDLVRTGGIGEFIAQGVTVPGRFLDAARKVAKAGWRAEVHSLGRRTPTSTTPPDYELEITAFETVNQEFPGVVADKRWVIGHVPGITQEWINRFAAIGGSLSLTGWQFLAGNPQTNPLAPYAGPPFRMIVDSNIHAGMSSDGMQIAPMNPWIHMYFATTGINARGVLINPAQQITRQEVLGLYTRENGWFVREEDQLGSIEEGKLADLAVLNRDYFKVPDEELKRIRSILTVVDGEVVYDRGVVRFDRDHRDRRRDDDKFWGRDDD